MDGVIADFDAAIKEVSPELETSDKFENYEERSKEVDKIVIDNPGFFTRLKPMEGAINAVDFLFNNFEVYFLSTPMWNVPDSYRDKRIWLEKHFGEKAHKRLILTHRKDLCIGDYLIDDRTRNGAGDFKGELIQFGSYLYKTWHDVIAYFYITEDMENNIEVLRHIFRWTSIFDKEGNRLEIPITRYLKELEDSHLEALLVHVRHNKQLVALFTAEINYRNNE
jgi:5'(3')-deoxyribonucleotidase